MHAPLSCLHNESRVEGHAIPWMHQKRPRTQTQVSRSETLGESHERPMERAGVDAEPERARVMVHAHFDACPSDFSRLHAKDDLQATPIRPAGKDIVAVPSREGSSSAYDLAAAE